MKEYRTEYYKDPTSRLLIIVFSFLFAVAIAIWAIRSLDINKSIGLGFVILIIVAFIIALFAQKKVLTKDAILLFGEEQFEINIYEQNSEILDYREVFQWRDISSYKFYFDTKNNTCLTIYPNNAKKELFIFRDNKTYEQAASQESVFSLFYSCIKKEASNGHLIMPNCGFFASKTGAFLIWSEVALLCFAALLHLITNTWSHAYYLLIAVGTLIPQIANRAQNKAMYDKISKIA